MKGSQLAQSHPTDTNNASVISPDGSEVIHITEVTVCNTSSSAVTYRIFHDEDGTTYDTTTARFYDISLPGNTTDVLETNWWMRDSTGNLAVRVGTGSTITFTFDGELLQA